MEVYLTYAIYAFLIVTAGAGEYLHLLPAGTLGALFFAIAGHLLGTFTSPTLSALKQNTKATQQNTAIHEEVLSKTDEPLPPLGRV